MAARRSMREAENKLSAAIKPYRKYYDFVDLKIVPILKKGKLYKKLIEDKTIKKLLYTEQIKLSKLLYN